jgi:hypothetical protein
MSVTHRPGWTTSDEQLRILQSSPYEETLKQQFPEALAEIISSYVQEDLGPNVDNWYKALRKIHALPQSIPPLPPNIREILEAACPIYGAPQRLKDTHTLWLIPGGKIKDIDALAAQCGERTLTEFLGPRHLEMPAGFISDLRTPESVEFEQPEWVIISGILPESLRKTLYEQRRMIEKLRDKSFVNYEMPRFKYALAANLLKIQVDKEGLWLNPVTPRRLTRVQEEFYNRSPNKMWGTHCSLNVGSTIVSGGYRVTQTTFCATNTHGFDAIGLWDNDVGMAAMWVGFSPKPQSSCVMS